LTDDGHPECAISGDGTVTELGSFRGPGQLGALLAASPELSACAVTQVFRYAEGRHETDDDAPVLRGLDAMLHTDRLDFLSFLLEYTTSEAFRHRVLVEP
jgi:hypothetical protein